MIPFRTEENPLLSDDVLDGVGVGVGVFEGVESAGVASAAIK